MLVPLVSVIIPTHNRASYAVPTIRSVLAASPDIEVVVCDTSEVDLISSEFINDPDISRLNLVRPNRPMSVVDNFNEAMSAATGEYLVFIGDDDFVSSKIVDVAKWATKEQVDSVKFTFPVHYYWPDYIHRTRGDGYSGVMYIAPFTGAFTQHDAKKALTEALRSFGGGVFEMPRAYAGMISRELADRICKKYGALFGGVSPDIYSAALISLESSKCVKVDYPAIIPGASGASTAGQSAQGKHVGGLRDNPHIGAFKNLKWDERIPEFYSVPTVWSYSLLKAVEVSGFELKRVNFLRLYTKCVIFQRTYVQFTLISLSIYIKNNGLFRTTIGLLAACVAEILWIIGKFYLRLTEKLAFSNKIIVKDLKDTFIAQESLRYHLNNFKLQSNLKTSLADCDGI